MKPRSIVILAVVAVLGCGVVAFASPPGLFTRPTPKPTVWRAGPQDVKLTLISDPDLKAPRLYIPRSLLVTTADGKKVGAAGHLPPIASGLALSSALVAGGLWFAGKGSRRIKAALVITSVLVVGAGSVMADIPGPWWEKRERRYPPLRLPLPEEQLPEAPKHPAEIELPADIKLPADIQIEIISEGDHLRLAIPAKPQAAPPGAALHGPIPVKPAER
jgi:hypothetical protein